MQNELLGGRYRIRELLGEGGMARVYVAIDEKLGRKVAIKVLHQHFAENKDVRQRFEMEATAISSMDHRNILKVYDFSGRDSEQLWIVTEILKGKNLAQFAESFPKGALHPIVATCIVRELTKALDHAHGCQLIHRDIKPENIMVLSNGGIKLMDFGIAKNLHTSSVTLTGTFMGSPSYMSPEQVRGRDIDLRSDIYSLGVLFYEIVTGRLPYIGNTTHDVIIKIVEGNFLAPRKVQPNLPVELDKIICKAMSKNAKLRYQISRSFARDLDIFLQRLGFVESHVELERFFTDRKAYEAKLNRRLHNPTQRTKEPNSAKPSQTKERLIKDATSARFNTKHQGTKYIDAATVRAHNDLSIANPYQRTLAEVESARYAVKNDPRRDRMLHSEYTLYQPKLKRRAALKANTAIDTSSQTQQQNPRTSLTNLKPVPAVAVKAPVRRRRMRQPLPRRTRPQQRLHPRLVAQSRPSNFAPLLGFLLIGLLLVLAILGFWSVSSTIFAPNESTVSRPAAQQITPHAGGEQTQPLPKAKATDVPRAMAPDPRVTPKRPKQRVVPRASPTKQHPKTEVLRPTAPPGATPIAPPPKSAVLTPGGKKAKAHDTRPIEASEATQQQQQSSPKTASPEPATILIATNVSANILLNGRNIGTTIDATSTSGWKEIPAGRHTIELVRPGYETYRLNVSLSAGEQRRLGTMTLRTSHVTQTVTVTIQSQQTPVKLTIVGDSGVQSQIMNHSPYQISLEEGQYRLKLEHQGKSIERRVNVRNQSGPLTISVDFSKI